MSFQHSGQINQCVLCPEYELCPTSVCVIESSSCSAQQRTAANATKKRVMPNQVTASTLHSPIPHVKPPHHCSITAAAFSCCFFYFLFFLSLSQHVSPCHCCPALLCIYTHSCLCPSCPSSLFPFPLSRPLFLHFFFFLRRRERFL